MHTLTFKEARDKIIEAYFKDEIKPLSTRFCFCGTLNNSKVNWMNKNITKNALYTPKEYALMEAALLTELVPFGTSGGSMAPGDWGGWLKDGTKEFEEALFRGMSKALDVLREIHESRGEAIDPIEFKKRELVKA